MEHVAPAARPSVLGARLMMVALLIAFLLLVRAGLRRRAPGRAS
jgi:hypothetical protein